MNPGNLVKLLTLHKKLHVEHFVSMVSFQLRTMIHTAIYSNGSEMILCGTICPE